MAENKANKPLYDGALATPVPMELPAVAAILGPRHPDVVEAMRKQNQAITDEIMAKFPMLFDHYKIPMESENSWAYLAFRLARTHVPGMQTVTRRRSGAPKDWGPVELTALNFEVGLLIKQGISTMEACRALLQLPDGTWRFPRVREAKTLYRRYQDSKRVPLVAAINKCEDPRVRQVFELVIAKMTADDQEASITDT